MLKLSSIIFLIRRFFNILAGRKHILHNLFCIQKRSVGPASHFYEKNETSVVKFTTKISFYDRNTASFFRSAADPKISCFSSAAIQRFHHIPDPDKRRLGLIKRIKKTGVGGIALTIMIDQSKKSHIGDIGTATAIRIQC